MATDTSVADVEKAIGYAFEDKSLLRLALTAAGATEGKDHEGNKNLALIGQGVINIVIGQDGHRKRVPGGECFRSYVESDHPHSL